MEEMKFKSLQRGDLVFTLERIEDQCTQSLTELK